MSLPPPRETPAPRDILHFWFGENPSGSPVPPSRRKLWFGGEKHVDLLMREQFGEWVKRAGEGELDHWSETPGGRLALILLLDQFPRNIFRHTGRAYAFDEKARSHCLHGRARNQDLLLSIVERAFFYLPLEHAEDLQMQRQSVACFTALADEAPTDLKPLCRGFLDFARRHLRIIERFGRFPHRNAALGRDSTEEEKIFLLEPGSSF